MALFDDNFLTVLRNGIQSQADAAGLKVQIEDAQNDVAKQLDQINNFIASGVDAIIVNPVDTSATQAMTDAAGEHVVTQAASDVLDDRQRGHHRQLLMDDSNARMQRVDGALVGHLLTFEENTAAIARDNAAEHLDQGAVAARQRQAELRAK